MFRNLFSDLRTYLVIAAVLAVVTSFVVGTVTYKAAETQQEQALIARADIMALSLDPHEIGFLAGNAQDVNNPFYSSIKHRLEQLATEDPDARFVDLLGARGSTIFTYANSAPQNSLDHAVPGEQVFGAHTALAEVFRTGHASFETPTAEGSGTWVTAFAPLEDPLTNETVAVLGLHVPASVYQQGIILSVALPILLVLTLFLLFLVVFTRYRKEREIMSLKLEFLSIASHDLRSPLTGLSWALQTLSKEVAVTQNQDLYETVTLMNKSVEGLTEVVKSILDFSRIESRGSAELQLSTIDLFELVRGSVDSLTLYAREHKITISMDADWKENTLCVGDRDKLKRAIGNVISNAIKYSNEGGEVTIGYQKGDGTESVDRSGKPLPHVIRVTDAGSGIPQAEQGNIFSKFFRAHNAATSTKPGTGLGLYVAKQIIETHQGKMWFTSKEHVGTTFYIQLPAKEVGSIS